MTNSYELLKNPEQTLADAGIYGGQVHSTYIILVMTPCHVYTVTVSIVSYD